MEQNKTGKYIKYAIGEILLVMVGILLALQVNNWNQERQKAKKEKYYLNSIKSSIQLSQNELNRVISDAELISSSADTLVFLIAQEKYALLEGAFLDSLMYSTGDYSKISLNDGGIQEILNTGSLDLIKDERIRKYLASWNNRMHQIRKFEDETEYLGRNYQNYLMPYIDIKRYISNPLESIIIPDRRLQLLTDPVFTNYLAKIGGIHYGMHRRYSQEKAELDSLSLLIDNYLVK